MQRIRQIGLIAAAGLAVFVGMASCAQSEVIVAHEIGDAAAEAGPGPGLVPPPPGDACAPLGCNKVDVLLVVDNSLSMAGAQRRLNEAAPAFLKQMTTKLDRTDFHLMVVDTDAAGYERICNRTCPQVGFDASIGENQGLCVDFPCASISERSLCDSTLGAGVVYPVGANSSNRSCNFPDGRRYLTSEDDDLEERFLCSAAVGTLGDGNERPIGAMLAALGVESQKGGCNEGFLRDDALLVVVIVSDAGSTATELESSKALEWRQQLLDLKCGREEGVVVMAVGHDGSQIAPWYSALELGISIVGYENDLVSQWRDYCSLVPGDACCCMTTCPEPPEPFDPNCFPSFQPHVCDECASKPPPWNHCWFAFTGYGTPLVRFSDSFGERGLHREICDDFSGILDGTLEAVRKACAVF
ncbi:MAG: hypothetical protein KIS78_23220 [Labilithrix sp.]|nr:hypothetical protein [Labilithrix sp.]